MMRTVRIERLPIIVYRNPTERFETRNTEFKAAAVPEEPLDPSHIESRGFATTGANGKMRRREGRPGNSSIPIPKHTLKPSSDSTEKRLAMLRCKWLAF